MIENAYRVYVYTVGKLRNGRYYSRAVAAELPATALVFWSVEGGKLSLFLFSLPSLSFHVSVQLTGLYCFLLPARVLSISLLFSRRRKRRRSKRAGGYYILKKEKKMDR